MASLVMYPRCKASNVTEPHPLATLLPQVRDEIDLYSTLDHPHIVPFYCSFGDGRYIYIVMEAADEDLSTRVLATPFLEPSAQDLARQLVPALLHLHAKVCSPSQWLHTVSHQLVS